MILAPSICKGPGEFRWLDKDQDTAREYLLQCGSAAAVCSLSWGPGADWVLCHLKSSPGFQKATNGML